MAAESRLDLVNPELLRILRCPLCKGELALQDAALHCEPCEKKYPVVLGIPDLRIYEDPLIPLEDDYRKGEKVQAQAEKVSFADLVRYYWSLPTYPYTPPELAESFIRHVLTDEARVQGYIDKIGRGRAFLEVGCGTAALLKTAQPEFDLAVGCDVAFRWLLIARKRLQEAGQPVNLVCCCADYLPFPDGLFDSIASVALLEHVADARAVVNEFDRVAAGGARVFNWTTNRFSLAKEPHVGVWGVGFLPRRWMPAYVKWRSGLAYEKKRLLSRFEMKSFLRGRDFDHIQFFLPRVSAPDWEHLKGVERLGAHLFLLAAKLPVLRSLLLTVSPVILSLARRKTRKVEKRQAAHLESMSTAK